MYTVDVGMIIIMFLPNLGFSVFPGKINGVGHVL